MRRKAVYRSVGVLLSLFLVLGGYLAFRSAKTRLPHNPFQTEAQITAAQSQKIAEETTHRETQSATVLSEESATVRTSSSETKKTAVQTAALETQRSAETVTGFRQSGGLRSAQTASTSAFYGIATTTPTTTAPQTTAQPQTTVTKPYTPPFRAETTTVTTEPAQEEPQEKKPILVTDLSDRLVTLSELTDGKFSFQAYLAGDTDGYSLRVYLYSAGEGTGHYLSPDGVWYRPSLTVGVHDLTLYVKQGDSVVSEDHFTVRVEAQKASPEKPQIGKEPPVIETNLDDNAPNTISNSRYNFIVTAKTAKGAPIYADGICVCLDGREVYDPKTIGAASYIYSLYFDPPNEGDEETHTVTVLAWDGAGNSAFRTYTVTYRHIPEGEHSGEVTVVLDATTVGLGILEQETVPLYAGENAAQVLLRMLENCGYSCEYEGNTTLGFYLKRISRGDMCKGAAVPKALWKIILRDGITPNTAQQDRDSLGEYDYTMKSGWMYCVNQTLYPGTGMENCYLNPGDVLTVCFTLAEGKDIGGGMGGGYCGIWRGGIYTPLEHSWVEKTDAHGELYYECSICHATKKEEDAA